MHVQFLFYSSGQCPSSILGNRHGLLLLGMNLLCSCNLRRLSCGVRKGWNGCRVAENSGGCYDNIRARDKKARAHPTVSNGFAGGNDDAFRGYAIMKRATSTAENEIKLH